MKLLIIAQKVDMEDDILGFFHRWTEKFAEKVELLNVICLWQGKRDLPPNVKVFSLGKETGNSRLDRVFRFYKYIWSLRNEYDGVFVHMNPIYVVLGGIFWKIRKKKIILWHNHRYGNLITGLAVKLADEVFYTSPFSFAAKFKKSKRMPAGIDTEKFKVQSSKFKVKNSILYLGRISPIKNVDVLIEAAKILDKDGIDFVLNIVGEPGEKDGEYFKKTKNLSKELEIKGKIKFWGKVPNHKTPEIYALNEISANLSPSGSFDKTILEAMACEVPVIVSNKSFRGVLPDYLIFEERNFKELAEKIKNLLSTPEREREKVGKQMREIAVKSHSLEILSEKIISAFNAAKTLKVLFAIPHLGIGGAERLVVNQINHIDRKVFDPWLATLTENPSKNFREKLKLNPEKIKSFKFSGFLDVLSWLKLARFLREEKFDAVITNIFMANLTARVLAILFGVPVIISYEHNVYKEKARWQILCDRILAKFTDRIIAGSNDVKNYTAEQEKIHPKKISVIYNGIPINVEINLDVNRLRREFNFSGDEILIVTVGRLIEQKGHLYLIRAAKEVLNIYPRARFLIFGEGELKNKLEDEIRKLGLEKFVFLPGYRKIEEIFALADIFVMPSLWEGLSMVMLEAMDAGKPVVVTNVSGASEVVQDGINGFLIPVKDPAALADKIGKLIADQELRKKFGKEAKESVKRFSIENNVKNLENLILSLHKKYAKN